MAPLVVRQYDVCRNGDRSSRSRIPFLIVLQSDLLSPLETVVVAPVVAERQAQTIKRLNPRLMLSGKAYRVVMQELAGIPRQRLGEAVANVRDRHAEFVGAVDLLFTGV
jgi:toxin CcdB